MQKLIKISKLKHWEENPRKINKDQMKKLCNSLLEDPDFLSKRPILVNNIEGKLIVYCGNQRVRAAKALGWDEILCDIDENLSDDMMRKRIIKDNKTYGEWDFDLLANEWNVEVLLDCGFTSVEIQYSNNLYNEEKEEKPKKQKECPNCGHMF